MKGVQVKERGPGPKGCSLDSAAKRDSGEILQGETRLGGPWGGVQAQVLCTWPGWCSGERHPGV